MQNTDPLADLFEKPGPPARLRRPQPKPGDLSDLFDSTPPLGRRAAPVRGTMSGYVDPALESHIADMLGSLKQQGYDVRIGETYRPPEVQAQYFREGRSRTLTGNHPQGRAVDLIVHSNGQPDWNTDNPAWRAIGEEAKRRGLSWGGDFKDLYDPGHVELNGGDAPASSLPRPSNAPDLSDLFDSADDDEVVRIKALDRQTDSIARPVPQVKAPDIHTTAGQADRDTRQQAEADPDARIPVSVGLPEGKTDWSEVTSEQLITHALRQAARERNIPAEYVEQWVKKHPQALAVEDLRSGEKVSPVDIIGTNAYDPERRTMTLGLRGILDLQRDYQSSKGTLQRATDWATDDERTSGEKFLDVAEPIASTAAKGLDYASRPFSAVDAAVLSRLQTGNLTGVNPLADYAAAQAFTGEEVPEYAKNPIGERVRQSETLRDINPNLPGLVGFAAEAVTSPSNLIPAGTLKYGGKLARGTRLGARVAEALDAAGEARFARAGRVLDIDEAVAAPTQARPRLRRAREGVTGEGLEIGPKTRRIFKDGEAQPFVMSERGIVESPLPERATQAPKLQRLQPKQEAAKPFESRGDVKTQIKATDYINLDRLNIAPEEKQNLARIVAERVAETGVSKDRITFEDVKREAAALDPELVNNLKTVKDGETLDPALRYAAKQRTTALNSELVNVRKEIEQGRNTLTVEELDKLESRAALLEHDTKQLLDVLIPTRTAAGRALAFERMMVDAAGFDLEHWVARGRKIAERSRINITGKGWQKKEAAIRETLAEGSAAEAKLAEIEKVLGEKRVAPEIQAAAKAAAAARAGGASVAETRTHARRAVADGYKTKLTQMEQEARARLKSKLGASTLHDATDIGSMVADLSIIGGAKLARKGIDAATWGREMVDEFGPEVAKHLKAIYQRSYQLYQDERAASIKAARSLKLTGGDLSKFTTDEIDGLLRQAERERARVSHARVQLARTFTRLGQTHIATALSAYGKAGLLGQVGMIARDVVGTGGQQVVATIERIPASLTDMVVGAVTKRRTVTSLEPGALARSLDQMVTDGSREAVQIMRHGATREQLERMELPNEINSKSRVLNLYTNGIMRTRTAFDNFWMNQSLRRSLEDRARAQALTQVRAGELPRGRVRARTAELVARPPEDLAAEAVLDASYTLYHIDNAASNAVLSARSRIGPWGNAALDLVLPFAKFGANAVKMVFYDYTPANPLVESLRLLKRAGGAAAQTARARELSLEALRTAFSKSFSKEDQRRFSMAFGRGATGGGLMLAGYTLNRAGYMTGMRSEEEGERNTEEAAGRPPLSIYNPATKTWHSIGWLGPWGVTMGLGALWADSEGDENRFKKVGAGVAESLGQLPLLRASEQAIELGKALPSALGGAPEKLGNQAGRILSRNVPAPVSDAAQLSDDKPRDAYGLAGQLKSKVPYLRQQLPENRDVYDRPLEYRRTDSIDPTRTRSASDDPVDAEFVRLGVGVAETNRKPGDSAEEFRARRAQQGQTMERVRRAAIFSDGYKAIADDETRRAVLKGLIEYGREIAGVKLPPSRIEHNARVKVEALRLREQTLRDSSLSKEQAAKVAAWIARKLSGGMAKAKNEERTRAEVEQDFRDALEEVTTDLQDIIERAKER